MGLLLVTSAWALSWSQATTLAHHTFFAIWLGYILTVDGLVFLRSGTSLLTRSPARFAALFLASVPLWWLFELLNARLENWSYILPKPLGFLAYHLQATIAFSTVVPALFETAELYRTFPLVERVSRWRRFAPGLRARVLIAASGLTMIAATVATPDLFFPLVWVGLFLFVDPIVHALGGRSITGQVARGWWGTVWCLFLAGITCGFFWEMWNSRAMPKWVYDIAYAEQYYLFEMPALGYGGYLPFALETYALVMLLNVGRRIWPDWFMRLDQAPRD